MRFFFPDSQDLVDPSFDFITEKRSETRIRQRDDLYAHEVFRKPPYDGMLVSKAVVEGTGNVIIFRGAERNRRRGFHNVYVTYNRVKRIRGKAAVA